MQSQLQRTQVPRTQIARAQQHPRVAVKARIAVRSRSGKATDALDTVKENLEKAGHRVDEAASRATHSAQPLVDKVKDAVKGGQKNVDNAATKTAHAVDKAAKEAAHHAEEAAAKAKKALGVEDIKK